MVVGDPRPSRNEDRSGLRARDFVLIAIVALVPSLFSAWAIPLAAHLPDVSCAPDEGAHMEQVAELAAGNTSAWPGAASRMSMHLQTPYALHVGALLLAQRTGFDPAFAYRLPLANESYRGYPAARVASALLGALAVLALAAATDAATGSAAAARFTGLVAALYPQRFFVSAYVNNDVATFAAGAFLVLALARWLRAGEGGRGLPLVGVACGIVLLAKPNGYVLLPPTALWLGWRALRGPVSARQLFGAALLAIAIAAPVLVWNALRNGGFDVLGIAAYRAYVASDAWHGTAGHALPPHPVWVFARALSRSSFMKFSNMSVAIPAWLYAPWLLSLPVGLGLGLRRLRRAPSSAVRAALWLAGVVLLAAAAIVYECFWIDFSPQGRYVLLPVVLTTLVAWLAWTGEGDRLLRQRIALGYLVVVALWSLALLVEMPCGPGVPWPTPPP